MYGSHLGLEDIPEVVIIRPGHHRYVLCHISKLLPGSYIGYVIYVRSYIHKRTYVHCLTQHL